VYGAAAQMVDGIDYSDMDSAVAGIGAYGECLDHANEIDQDIAEGSKNFTTVFLDRFGDTKSTRKQARGLLKDKAIREYREGLPLLSTKQLAIYDMMRRGIDLRYMIRGLNKNLKPKVNG
jgi:hypothetical protein